MIKWDMVNLRNKKVNLELIEEKAIGVKLQDHRLWAM